MDTLFTVIPSESRYENLLYQTEFIQSYIIIGTIEKSFKSFQRSAISMKLVHRSLLTVYRKKMSDNG